MENMFLIPAAIAIVVLVAVWRELRMFNSKRRRARDEEGTVLPLSTGVPILPSQSAQISGRVEASTFTPDRLVISDFHTRVSDWVINDIKIGGRSIFAQSGDIPGDMFSPSAVNDILSFDPVEPGCSVVLVVTYVGNDEKGCPFFASMTGTRPRLKISAKQRKALRYQTALATR